MKKSKQQIRKEVEKVIEGFLISFVDEYSELNKTDRTKEACHIYVKIKAKKAKQAFIDLLSLDYTTDEVESFKTIESNWLMSIKTINDFELFLKKTKKTI
jgi:hypothetical protein